MCSTATVIAQREQKWSHYSGGGAPAFPTPAIETIGLGLGLGIAGVGIMGVGIAVCTHYSAAHMAYVVYVELLAFTYWHDNINCGMNIALIFYSVIVAGSEKCHVNTLQSNCYTFLFHLQ